MPQQFRKDPVTNRWVIVNVDKPKGAEAFQPAPQEKSTKACPFCPGNESQTPKDIVTVPKKNAVKGAASWQVRVVPNKFPALKIEESTDKYANGIYDKIEGFGAHEVIIETPEHGLELADAPIEEVETILKVYRDRCLDLRKDPRFKYILIFKNYGREAGASLEHPHSQLIGLPIVPSRVLGELKGSKDHFEYSDRCVFCDMLDQEHAEKALTVLETKDMISLCPFVSRFPFETWVMPKNHEENFDAITDEGIHQLATVLKGSLAKLKKTLNDPPFNFMIHTAPLNTKDTDLFHWHIEIIPHLTPVAGFEMATGFYVNPTPAEVAAKILKEAS